MVQAVSSDYREFLSSKKLVVPSCGVEVPAEDLHSSLFPFQKDLVRWSLRKGRAALFTGTGTGKTRMGLDWARHAATRTLMLAPLVVARQTVKEAARLGIPAVYCRSQSDAPPTGTTVTNFEMLHHFDPTAYGAVVIDESSCLKDFTTATRNTLIAVFRDTPMRLCLTATPAPNAIDEIGNHAEFLGVMTRSEMIAAFFVNRSAGKDLQLKRHGRDHFYRWLASWGMSLTKPSDIGYSNEGYELPELSIVPHFLETDYTPEGRLFAERLQGVTETASVRRQTIAARTAAAAALIEAEHNEPWIAWCGMNDEADRMTALIPGAVNVEGKQTPDQKADLIEQFVDGKVRVLVTKCEVAGFGMNLQHCARMVFVGMGHSYEKYYQAIRRCWRFGQSRPVKAHIVLTEPERCIYETVIEKEREAELTVRELVKHVAAFEQAELGQTRRTEKEQLRRMDLPAWLS